MKYKNLVLLGTSHIAKQSIEEVEKYINNENPEIVAIELDKSRLTAMLSKEKQRVRIRDIRRIGIKGYVFSLIGAWAEKKLGESVGVKPGSEMKKAFYMAKQKKLLLALIDQDIEKTLNNISKALTWKEKWNFFVDVFKAMILRKKEMVFDLTKVPSEKVIKKLTGKVKKRYPNLYRVLVDERNEVMAKNLAGIMTKNPDKKIVAIIGAGHEKEIMELIKENLKKPRFNYSFTIS